MKKLFAIRSALAAATVAVVVAVVVVGPNAFAADSKLTLTGSSTVAPLATEIGKLFEKKNAGTRVDVQSGGSSRGVADARAGLADIGMISRALKPDEKDLTGFPIALDGIAIILNKVNAVATLSNDQIIEIYKGQIKNWKEVGGKDAPITVVNKAEGRSTLELFLSYFKITNTEIKASVVIGDNEQGVKTVAGNTNAIGYVSVGTAEFNAKDGVAIKVLPLQGIEATIATVKAGTFPLSRPLLLVIKGEPTALQKKFLDFAQSSEVTELIKREYFVPITK